MSDIDVKSDNRLEQRGQSDGLGQPNPCPAGEVARRGQKALNRKRRDFEDWQDIAAALHVGRTESMRSVHTNEAKGKCYEKAMGDWLFVHSFHLIDKCTRNHLFECHQHRQEINNWRARLTEPERFRFNHPTIVLRKWKASTVVPNLNAPPRISA
jgi:hypothetical protein